MSGHLERLSVILNVVKDLKTKSYGRVNRNHRSGSRLDLQGGSKEDE
jgi:hypothetical protein